MVATVASLQTEVDPILTRIVAEDKVPWYKKPNLRILYFLLLPTCMGIEITSGFDSQMINALQVSWSSMRGARTLARSAILARAVASYLSKRSAVHVREADSFNLDRTGLERL